MIRALVPTLARLATETAEIGKRETLLLQLPDDVSLQERVSRASCLHLAALHQFVVQEGFQEA
jgi:hypothetical protein